MEQVSTAQDGSRRAFWESKLKEWSDSGLSQAGYCRRNGLSRNAFVYWKSALQGRREGAGQGRFVELRLPASLRRAEGIEISLPNGIRLSVGERCDPRLLRQIVQALGGR